MRLPEIPRVSMECVLVSRSRQFSFRLFAEIYDGSKWMKFATEKSFNYIIHISINYSLLKDVLKF